MDVACHSHQYAKHRLDHGSCRSCAGAVDGVCHTQSVDPAASATGAQCHVAQSSGASGAEVGTLNGIHQVVLQ